MYWIQQLNVLIPKWYKWCKREWHWLVVWSIYISALYLGAYLFRYGAFPWMS